VCFAQGEPEKDGRYYEAQARRDYASKDYSSFLSNISKAAELRPNHPRLLYNLAVAYALNGKSEAALDELARLSEMGLVMPAVRENSFAAMKESSRFKEILAAFERNKSPVGEATAAFTFSEKGLIAEGLAYDKRTGSYFVSSAHKRKIIRIDRAGTATDFVTAVQGLWAALGMKVDNERRCLWVATAAMPQMVDFTAADDGLSAVLKIDLASGKLLKKYVLENREAKHALGDVTLSKNGDVFTTDSLTPAVYVIRHDNDRLESFLADRRFGSPQGLAFSDDERWLYMADYGSGLFAIDTRTKEVRAVTPPPNVTQLGIDGLYFYRGDLIGVQNGVNPHRIVRIRLTEDQRSIRDFRVLCANHAAFDEPTLGVIVDTQFLFLANSQWGKISDDGKLAAAEQLRDPMILKLKL
jgi:hypothetical protein